jgi:hypothetical protein
LGFDIPFSHAKIQKDRLSTSGVKGKFTWGRFPGKEQNRTGRMQMTHQEDKMDIRLEHTAVKLALRHDQFIDGKIPDRRPQRQHLDHEHDVRDVICVRTELYARPQCTPP